jgi:hypothetical protein
VACAATVARVRIDGRVWEYLREAEKMYAHGACTGRPMLVLVWALYLRARRSIALQAASVSSSEMKRILTSELLQLRSSLRLRDPALFSMGGQHETSGPDHVVVTRSPLTSSTYWFALECRRRRAGKQT